MTDEATVDVYRALARQWAENRSPTHLDGVQWVNGNRGSGPIADLGTGPGWHLALCRSPAVGLDIARPMLHLTRDRMAGTGLDHPLIEASVSRLPFAGRSLGGAIATRVHVHLPLAANPAALADLHRCLQPDAPVLFEFLAVAGDGSGPEHSVSVPQVGVELRSSGPFANRLFSLWTDGALVDLLDGAGFAVETISDDGGGGGRTVRARRRWTLPDTVGTGMDLLICGLNPSPYAADCGIGFGRPGNRFWPAALDAGLVSVGRDPYHALLHHGVGMTDLVKRTTRRAAELEPDEYRTGLARVERLVRWLQPRAVCFVGLAGWRIAVDRSARAGVQETTVGGRPVYLMPSTSGLNANSTLADLTDHLRAAARLARQSPLETATPRSVSTQRGSDPPS